MVLAVVAISGQIVDTSLLFITSGYHRNRMVGVFSYDDITTF